MDNIDKLFDSLYQHNDYKILKYKYLQCIIRIIYLCLKYRYCYQIGLTQKIDWAEDIYDLTTDYCFGFYGDSNHEDMEFFYEGEELKEIFNDVVKLLTYQGYHDIPEDLYKEFTKDKICATDENGKCLHLLSKSWIEKYVRGKRTLKRFSDRYYFML